MKSKRKILTMLLATTLVLVNSLMTFGSSSKDIIYNSKELKKYEAAFDKLEKQAKFHRADLYKTQGVKLSNSDSSIITTTVPEGDSLVTLGLVYSLGDTDRRETTRVLTHAKVKLTASTQSTVINQRDYIRLTNITGQVLATYDGASLKEISVLAKQQTLFGDTNNRTEWFTHRSSSYSKNYNWPYITDTQGGVVGDTLGQIATFKFTRGSTTTSEEVTCLFWGQ